MKRWGATFAQSERQGRTLIFHSLWSKTSPLWFKIARLVPILTKISILDKQVCSGEVLFWCHFILSSKHFQIWGMRSQYLHLGWGWGPRIGKQLRLLKQCSMDEYIRSKKIKTELQAMLVRKQLHMCTN